MKKNQKRVVKCVQSPASSEGDDEKSREGNQQLGGQLEQELSSVGGESDFWRQEVLHGFNTS